jgi:hypothetical protein
MAHGYKVIDAKGVEMLLAAEAMSFPSDGFIGLYKSKDEGDSVIAMFYRPISVIALSKDQFERIEKEQKQSSESLSQSAPVGEGE